MSDLFWNKFLYKTLLAFKSCYIFYFIMEKEKTKVKILDALPYHYSQNIGFVQIY